MKDIMIYDMNNWVRVKMAESLGGASLSALWQELVAESEQKDFIFCVFDGYNSRKKRKQLYPDYKGKRKPADQSIYDGIKFFKELLRFAPVNIRTIEVPEYEADDVIANVACNMCSSDDNVIVISTDRDLTQLRKQSNITTLKEPTTAPQWVKTYKTLVGDSSDNIPGLVGFGDGAWNKLSDYCKDFLTVLFYLRWDTEEDKELLAQMEKDLPQVLTNKSELSPKMVQELCSEENKEKLHLWHQLVSFLPVNNELILKNFFMGNNNIDEAQSELANYEIGDYVPW